MPEPTGAEVPDLATTVEALAMARMKAALAPFGWTCTDEFWRRYYTDAWVFNLANAVERLTALLHLIATARRGDCGGAEFEDMDELPTEIERMWRDLYEYSERLCSDLPN